VSRTPGGDPAPFETPIYVTRPLLPPLSALTARLEEVWATQQLTNIGAQHERLEAALRDRLGVRELSLFTNGTVALITAIRALRLTGEVLTTPFTFPATPHALSWSGITPVFCDVDPRTLTVDPPAVERAITPRTTGILAVHVYGAPCDVDALQAIADRHRLRIIYDAAHAFGVRFPTESVLRYGDLSVLSFHATKVFTTFEGGAIVCPDAKTKQRIDHLKNFGFVNEITVVAPGINGKMSEVCAAMGLLQLRYVDASIARRKEIDATYRGMLKDVRGIRCLPDAGECSANYAYFPVLVDADYPLSRDELYQELKRHNIHPRRYFYPLISDFPMYRGLPSAQRDNLPVAARIADQILCLPISTALERGDLERVVGIIRGESASAQRR